MDGDPGNGPPTLHKDSSEQGGELRTIIPSSPRRGTGTPTDPRHARGPSPGHDTKET